jgi:uracil-DNA glycosylase family 4
MDLRTEYENWRARHDQGWGLAWYLAAEVMQRFYASHGIAAVEFEHEGLGYYGIGLVTEACGVHHHRKTLGRFTMAGNVENWQTGGPGDHGLNLVERAKAGEAVEPMVAEAIAHLGLQPKPKVSHLGCRHRRWGSSAVLVFRLAAALALRYNGGVQIVNAPEFMDSIGGDLDPKKGKKEHLGWTRFSGKRDVILANDGRVLKPDGEESIWTRYMRGESEDTLLGWLEGCLGLEASSAPPGDPTWRTPIRACRTCHEKCPDAIYTGPEGAARPLFHEEGSLDTKILFVGEAPNLDDTFDPNKGRLTIGPWSDISGKYVYKLLSDVLGVDPTEVLFTNAALCLPAGSAGKHPLTTEQRKHCAVHLRTTIEEVSPDVVVTLGATALQAVKAVEKHSLKLKSAVATAHPWFGRLLFPLYQPRVGSPVQRSVAQQGADWLALRNIPTRYTAQVARRMQTQVHYEPWFVLVVTPDDRLTVVSVKAPAEEVAGMEAGLTSLLESFDGPEAVLDYLYDRNSTVTAYSKPVVLAAESPEDAARKLVEMEEAPRT